MSKTRPYREILTESLTDPVQAKHYLRAILQDYPEGFLKALGNVARANQMSKVAESAGIQRESLYRSLSDNGNPTWETLVGIAAAVGLKFTVLTLDEDPYPPEEGEEVVIDLAPQRGLFKGQTLDVYFEKSMSVTARTYQLQSVQSEEAFGCLGIKIPSVVQPIPKLVWLGENNGRT